MIQTEVARRYATALADLAQERNELVSLERAWDTVRKTLEASPDLDRALSHPGLRPESQVEVLRKVFSDLHPLLLNLLSVLVKRRRWRHWSAVARIYGELSLQRRGIVKVKLETARALGEETQQEMTKLLREKTGKEINLDVQENRDLIGGVKVHVGDRIYDGSLAGRLAVLGRQLAQG